MGARSICRVCLLAGVALLAAGCDWIVVVNVDPAGAPSGSAANADLTDGGRLVAFISDAPDLVPGDTNGLRDAFVYDAQTGAVERVSVASDGTGSTSATIDVAISDDGRFVAFVSLGALVPGDTDAAYDAFVHDRSTGTTTRISDNSATPVTSADISGDGRVAAYGRAGAGGPFGGPTIVHHELATGAQVVIAGDLADGVLGASDPELSDDGTVVAYVAHRSAGGPTGFTVPEVTVRDLAASTTTRIAQDAVTPAISGDGRFVAYTTGATGLLGEPKQVERHDRSTGDVVLVSATPSGQPGAGDSALPALSDDGQVVAFSSTSPDVIGVETGAVQVCLLDLATGARAVASQSADGALGDGDSTTPSLSGNGRRVAFESSAANLVNGAGTFDVFLRPVRTLLG